MHINGQKANLLFDTGSFDNILTAPAAERLGMHMIAAKGTISGVGGAAAIGMATAASVGIGRLKGRDLRFPPSTRRPILPVNGPMASSA